MNSRRGAVPLTDMAPQSVFKGDSDLSHFGEFSVCYYSECNLKRRKFQNCAHNESIVERPHYGVDATYMCA